MRHMLWIIVSLICTASLAMADPARWRSEWPKTDFQQTKISNWAEVLDGGPPRDGIPAILDPSMKKAADEVKIAPREPVVTLQISGTARAYPIRYLMWHEIVNDVVDGRPVAVTYCPLCNTAMAFDRRVAGQTLEFGVSGKLRHSDMIMFDRQTDSWWQQALGQGIVGDFAGVTLDALPVVMESWQEFRTRHPDGLVMQEPDHPRSYGRNPYQMYDSAARPFLYRGENPPHGILPLARVVRVGNRAWPLSRLRVAKELREAGLVLRWEAGQASALDASDIGQGREVGTVRVTDVQGQPVVYDIPFAFAFHAFHPNGEWMLSE